MEDIVEEICLRLPLKSLFRCKCLSKKWNCLISYNTSFRRSYLERSMSSSPLMLGFFLHGCASSNRGYDVYEHRVDFVPTCPEGCKLKAGDPTWGAEAPPHGFKEDLSFLGHEKIFIAASSNGFLLCTLEQYNPMSYYVCNPITQEWVALPKPKFTSWYSPAGFICEGHYPCFDMVHYKVVRAIWPKLRTFSNSLTIEVFSSVSFKWEVFHITHPISFLLHYIKYHVVITGGEFHWLAFTNDLTNIRRQCALVFNQDKKCLQLFQVPGENIVGDYHLGESNGLVLFAKHNIQDLEIWVLGKIDDERKEWSLKYRVSLEIPMGNHPELFYGLHKNFQFISFHPWNPLILYIRNYKKLICYDVENSRMEVLADHGSRKFYYFIYIWPTWPAFFP